MNQAYEIHQRFSTCDKILLLVLDVRQVAIIEFIWLILKFCKWRLIYGSVSLENMMQAFMDDILKTDFEV